MVHATTSTDHNSSHLPYSIAPHAPTTFSNLNLRAMANHLLMGGGEREGTPRMRKSQMKLLKVDLKCARKCSRSVQYFLESKKKRKILWEESLKSENTLGASRL